MISEEHKNVKGIYGTIRLKKHIENKLKLVLNHKLIRRYKNILGLELKRDYLFLEQKKRTLRIRLNT